MSFIFVLVERKIVKIKSLMFSKLRRKLVRARTRHGKLADFSRSQEKLGIVWNFCLLITES